MLIRVRCSTIYAQLLFRDWLLCVEREVDDFLATWESTSSRFPPSPPQLNKLSFYFLSQKALESVTPGSFPPASTAPGQRTRVQ
jgi:hypothetical protein